MDGADDGYHVITVYVTWDAEHLQDKLGSGMDGTREVAEMELREQFPPVYDRPHAVYNPKTVVDKHGRVLVWALPRLFSNGRQVCVPVSPVVVG